MMSVLFVLMILSHAALIWAVLALRREVRRDMGKMEHSMTNIRHQMTVLTQLDSNKGDSR